VRRWETFIKMDHKNMLSCGRNLSGSAQKSKVGYCEHVSATRTSLEDFFHVALQPNRVQWPPHSRGFRDHTHDAPQSVGLLWTSDQSVAETST
jgi:hypothetical protein